MRYGMLVVIGPREKGLDGRAVCVCRCDCGTVKTVREYCLRRKTEPVRSCGCQARKGREPIHGMRNTRTYAVWRGMKNRCTNEKDSNYRYYGGRGITVCRRWMAFENFLADMGVRPAGLWLDRINNDKGYSPRNCRWATPLQQARNKQKTVFIKFRGERLCLSEWAERTGISRHCIRARQKAGWSVRDALTAPPQGRVMLSHRGKTLCVADWASALGIHRDTLYGRLRKGWSVLDTLTAPYIAKTKQKPTPEQPERK